MMSRRGFLTRTLGLLGVFAYPRLAVSATALPELTQVLAGQHLKLTATLGGGGGIALTLDGLQPESRLWSGAPFSLLLADGSQISAADMVLTAQDIRDAHGIEATLQSKDGRLQVQWSARLPQEAHYLRQSVTLKALAGNVAIERVVLFNGLQGRPSGTVRGCPVVTDTVFYAFEHPLAETVWTDDKASLLLPRSLPLVKGRPVTYGSVIGVAQAGQMRRAFNAYIEATRPRKTAPFLHYNSWYDLGFSDIRFDEAGASAAVEAFSDKLTRQRGVALQSFLMDDGWDDPKSLWDFHDGFPQGFAAVADKAKAAGAALGVWMSPWGGYGNEKAERLKYGASQGFETNRDGFALSGRKYYARFRDACLQMIRRFGVNQFKLDGMGDVNSASDGSVFDSDFDAAIGLITELRREKPELYINLTYGTFASPFWLHYADSVWRGGKDHDHAGQGTKRQQWITYRDADTYDNVVKKSDLFPLHSLMLHGIIYAQHTPHLKTDPFGDFAAEVKSFFGSGTQLQELYITPSLLSDANWDMLARGARFARDHAAILHDTHWVGGHPMKSEIYGWAAWHESGALLTLRNPSPQEQSIRFDIAQWWELPSAAATRYVVTDAWDEQAAPQNWAGGTPVTLTLAPFAVQSFLARPAG